MEHLSDVAVDDLQRTLDSINEKTPALRLIAAIAYKKGITQSELAEWFDVERKTIYNWLTRLEAGDLDSAIRDAQRAGRPRKLSDPQLDELEAILQNPPSAVGIDAPAWTTERLQQFVRDRFEISYSRPSCRRLMKEAGLRYQPPGAAADADDREAVEQEGQTLRHVWLPG